MLVLYTARFILTTIANEKRIWRVFDVSTLLLQWYSQVSWAMLNCCKLFIANLWHQHSHSHSHSQEVLTGLNSIDPCHLIVGTRFTCHPCFSNALDCRNFGPSYPSYRPLKPGSYYLRMRMRSESWRHKFATNNSQQLNSALLPCDNRCEWRVWRQIRVKFASHSHSQKVWTGL